MTEQEKIWFNELSNEHAQDAKTFQKPNYRGMWDRIVDMYKESAHFVYELIQNADDALATEAYFDLKSDRLIFCHNGTRHFSISDPANEENDRANGMLGDINSITSIGFSTKADANNDTPSNSIGKFGIGFKSVFAYTETPEIYDENACFRIREKIIPELIEKSCVADVKWKTVFVIPFNNPSKTAEKAISEISLQLENMHNPTLFLNSLKKISYQFIEEGSPKEGSYQKVQKESKTFVDPEETLAEYLSLEHRVNDKVEKESLWAFSRKLDSGLKFSVGFFVKDGKLISKSEPAYCFFQTQEDTHLSFIIHAPFLLTPDRQHLKDGEEHNKSMLDYLAMLAADSFVYLRDIGVEKKNYLIDDDFLSIVPTREDDFFYVKNEYSYILGRYQKSICGKKTFYPFYNHILKKFKSSELFPAKNCYVEAAHAFWAEDSSLIDVFSSEDVASVAEQENAQWILLSKPKSGADEGHRLWMSSVIGGSHFLNEDYFLQHVTSGFCEEKFKNIPEWFVSFYEWLGSAKKRTESAKTRPFFINKSGEAMAAFKEGILQIFLPVENSAYPTVHEFLYKNASIETFFHTIGLKEPSLKDEIYTIILPRQRILAHNSEANLTLDSVSDLFYSLFRSDFKKIFKYYEELPSSKVDEYLNDIRQKLCVVYKMGETDNFGFSTAENLYIYSDELNQWFENCSQTKFLYIDLYKDVIDNINELEEFFLKLGASKKPKIVKETVSGRNKNDLYDELKKIGVNEDSFDSYGKKRLLQIVRHFEYSFDVVDNSLSLIESRDSEKSKLLWNYLKENVQNIRAEKDVRITLTNSVNNDHYVWCTCNAMRALLTLNEWLLTKNEEWKNPYQVYVEDLADIYDVTSDNAKQLLQFFLINNRPVQVAPQPVYDQETQKKIDVFNRLKEAGIDDLTDDEIMRIRQERQRNSETIERVVQPTSSEEKITWEISERAKRKKPAKTAPRVSTQSEEVSPVVEEAEDGDEFIKASVDYSKKIEKAKDRCAFEVGLLQEYENAQNLVNSSKKYSYQWFSALLKLEVLESNDENQNSREVSISFSKVEKDPSTQKTLILKQPNKNIPSVIEDLYGVNLELRLKDGSQRNLPFDSASIHSFALRVKLMHADQLQDLDLSEVVSASIHAKSPVFLLKSLQEQFDALQLDANFDMQQSLCENIKFIFGPPGTGKTTYLVRNVLQPLVNENSDVKILVLTPTNKSADVIVNRFKESYPDSSTYEDWLVRFGVTNDEEIEKSKIFCGRNFSFDGRHKTVMVTTIARLPYDSMIDENQEKVLLRDIEWDYIVVDESSMIPLVQMAYLLYSQKPTQFIVAGDPFQIEPTVAVSLWKDENIYSMVGLNSFTDIRTVPHAYEVVTLDTQYRSIPCVGEIFSKLTYNGVLKHARKEEDRKSLNIGKYLDYDSLNLVKFPMYRYESIYKSKRLGKSSYQVYSAIFAYEFACYIAKNVALENPEGDFKIGIISPYGAQAKLINNLLLTELFPECVSVTCGTIHGFQGDECDVLLTVFNPPEGISASDKMFLNHKNIINVAISRARDYLFVLMPDENTEKLENLKLVNQVETLMRANAQCKVVDSHSLEKTMFGNELYLEENSFSTGHQSVNVYGIPEKIYEIRSEDEAIDIQLHKS